MCIHTVVIIRRAGLTYEQLSNYIKPEQKKDWLELEEYLVSLGMDNETAMYMFDPLRASIAGHPCIDITKFGRWIVEKCDGIAKVFPTRKDELTYLLDLGGQQ